MEPSKNIFFLKKLHDIPAWVLIVLGVGTLIVLILSLMSRSAPAVPIDPNVALPVKESELERSVKFNPRRASVGKEQGSALKGTDDQDSLRRAEELSATERLRLERAAGGNQVPR